MSLARWSLEGPAAAARRTMRDARPGLCAGGRVAVNEGRACYPSDGQQSNRTGGRGVTNIWMRSCSADLDGLIRTDQACPLPYHAALPYAPLPPTPPAQRR